MSRQVDGPLSSRAELRLSTQNGVDVLRQFAEDNPRLWSGLAFSPTLVCCANEVLLALGGTSIYRAVVEDCGWSHSEYTNWFVRMLSQQLLAT